MTVNFVTSALASFVRETAVISCRNPTHIFSAPSEGGHDLFLHSLYNTVLVCRSSLFSPKFKVTGAELATATTQVGCGGMGAPAASMSLVSSVVISHVRRFSRKMVVTYCGILIIASMELLLLQYAVCLHD